MEMPIGHRIRAWRKHFGRSQADCAGPMGIQHSGLSRIENGYRDTDGQHRHQDVTAEQLEKLVAYLGLTMVAFYGEIPDAPAEPSTDKLAAANG